MKQKLLTVNEVAERLQVQKETIRLYIKKGLLKALKLPNCRYRIDEEDVESFISPRSDKCG